MITRNIENLITLFAMYSWGEILRFAQDDTTHFQIGEIPSFFHRVATVILSAAKDLFQDSRSHPET